MSNVTYPEQDKPIYRWVLSNDGVVTKLPPITSHSARYNYYFFKLNNSPNVHTAKTGQFDCFIIGKGVYSFEDNDKKAMAIIEEALKCRYDKIKKEWEAISERWEGFKSKN